MTAEFGDPAHQVSVEIDEGFPECPDVAWFDRVARATLAVAGFDRVAEVSLLITTDEEVRALNARYRGLDEPTDVLSFALLEEVAEGESFFADGQVPTQAPEGFLTPPEGAIHLGDVVISFSRAVEQAREAGRDTEHELAHLTAHGILHLLGYDHQEPDEEARMRAKENAVLGQIQ